MQQEENEADAVSIAGNIDPETLTESNSRGETSISSTHIPEVEQSSISEPRHEGYNELLEERTSSDPAGTAEQSSANNTSTLSSDAAADAQTSPPSSGGPQSSNTGTEPYSTIRPANLGAPPGIAVLRVRTTEEEASALLRDLANNVVSFSDLLQSARAAAAAQASQVGPTTDRGQAGPAISPSPTVPPGAPSPQIRPTRVIYPIMERPRVNNNNNNNRARNNNTNTTNALITVRNQLFYTLFVKAALFYARTFPRPVRRFLEFFFLLLVSVGMFSGICLGNSEL